MLILDFQKKNHIKEEKSKIDPDLGSVSPKLSKVFCISYLEFCILITSSAESEKIERNKIQGKCKVQQFHITDRIVE